MYFRRQIEPKLAASLKQYPVVTLMGPRQSGKTTLIKHALPNYPYVNLEDPSQREVILADVRSFFDRYPNGLILDEIQRMPSLLSTIQVLVDQQSEKTGLFVLTGSHQFELHQAISQSLAGRTALLTLLPLTLEELSTFHSAMTLDEILLTGFYPRIYQKNLNPTEVYRYYLQTYVERDIRQLIHLRDLTSFQRFIKLCVGRIGQVINLSNLSNEVGVSAQTIGHWLSLLEASYLIIRLVPYFENFGKRIIKSPKLYFTDVGFATFLLDIENTNQLSRDPLRGNLFENLVIMDILKQRYNQGNTTPLYYFRDQHGNEVDLILKTGNQLIAVEIKASQTFSPHFLKGLDYFQTLIGERYQQGYLIYSGNEENKIRNHQLVHYAHISQYL